ncbi:helix-turn-helix domain-containing protein [Gordonia sp. OPL2]|uniref:helix-turn-helix domain-containing protein n=1 Tax=Gordonia sp. OPL2 TaxID=2486274 RepID=UPI001654FC75|nr:helix-turn-helix domain-containing protein [Gordonia sp. OPL2]ROZ99123.1 TetR/AcrR family transcriptional regulator [Gordonia sp. OPL2]
MRRTSRQREAGEQTRRETRRRLLVAARKEFAERGYGQATVSRIADRAGVTVPTLYSAWGSKRELLRGVMEAAVSGSDDKGVDASAPPVPMRPGVVLAGGHRSPVDGGGDVLPRDGEPIGPDPAEVGPTDVGSADPEPADVEPEELIRFLVAQFRMLAERSAFGWRTYRDAAAVDPEAATDWAALMDIRRSNFRHLFGQIPDDRLRVGLTAEAAADTAWVIASPDTYDQLVRHAGYSLDEFADWVATTLIASILR